MEGGGRIMSRHTNWRGTLIRLVALATLALALAGPLAMGVAPAASAMGATPSSCGAASSVKSGCGPQVCAPVTAKDYALPTTSPRGGVRASLSRAGGVSGSTDTLTGSGWPAGATVELRLGAHNGQGVWVDPMPFVQGVADASGHVTIRAFQTPPIEQCMTKDMRHFGDNQALFVAQTPDARARVSLLFTFHPTPQLVSQQLGTVAGGQLVEMAGAGWEPGQVVIITPGVLSWPSDGYPTYDPATFQRLLSAATTVSAQRDGTFAITATIPQEPPETQITYFATASGPRNGDVSVQLAGTFSVRPAGETTLTLSRSAALAGAAVTLTGTNWPADQAIRIEYCREHTMPLCRDEYSQTLAVTHADGAGRLNVTVHIPADARPGPITIQVNVTASPFDLGTYAQTWPFQVLYPFAQAHPRLEMAIHASPFAAAALLIALLALAQWLTTQRRRRLATA
jgi:hypothetical protein